ncbi:Endo-1,4-beta-xylanase 4 [Fusarium oxysporum f. sp. albedinis]|nr:Endo-1,4-beta-xylanase 4 [Fusarium oxysporum f. sp. albedinis]
MDVNMQTQVPATLLNRSGAIPSLCLVRFLAELERQGRYFISDSNLLHLTVHTYTALISVSVNVAMPPQEGSAPHNWSKYYISNLRGGQEGQ